MAPRQRDVDLEGADDERAEDAAKLIRKRGKGGGESRLRRWCCGGAPRERSRFARLRGAICVLLLLFILQLFWGANFLDAEKLRGMYGFFTAPSVHEGLPPIGRAEKRYNDQNTAVALLGLGAMASQLKCEAAVESLGAIGGWSGRVYLFTDKPQCFEVDDMRKDSGVDLRMVHIDGDYSGAFALPSLGATKGNRLRAKLLKSRLFKEIDDETVTRLVYMDCDEVVAIPGCVEPMVTAMFANWQDNEDIRFRINSPGGPQGQFEHPDTFNIHAGFFAARRDRSWKALEEWEIELSTLKYAHDRMAYFAAMKRVQQNALAANGTIDGDLNYMRVGAWRGDWERFLDVSRPPEELTCVIHVSHKRCLWQGRKKVQSFVGRLGLETYKRHGDASYCESVLAYPLTLGWVPYHSCRKIESLL